MEKILTKSNKSKFMMDLKFIDALEGTIKFEGNLSQYKTMLLMFDKLTVDEYIEEIARALKKEEISHAIAKLKTLSEAAEVNELKRYCRICFNLIESLEAYEQKFKSVVETIDCFKTFLDETVAMKHEIEEFTGKPVSFEEINRVFTMMKTSIEGKRLFENSLSLPLQENKIFDEKKLTFGDNERKEIKIPESNEGQRFTSREENPVRVALPVTKSINIKESKENDEKCSLI